MKSGKVVLLSLFVLSLMSGMVFGKYTHLYTVGSGHRFEWVWRGEEGELISTFNDWTPVGSDGYGDYVSLTTPYGPGTDDFMQVEDWFSYRDEYCSMEVLFDDPSGYGPYYVAPPNTWFGYQWTVPAEYSDERIKYVTIMIDGMFEFSMWDVVLLDENNNVLVDLTEGTYPPINSYLSYSLPYSGTSTITVGYRARTGQIFDCWASWIHHVDIWTEYLGDYCDFASDLNDDCKVDFGDVSVFADSWLDCTDPADSNCVTPPSEYLTYEGTGTNKPSTWFGYYHACTVWDGTDTLSGTNWGNALPDVGSYTNLNGVNPEHGLAMINTAVENHTYMSIGAFWYLFYDPGSGYVLKPDYQDWIDQLAQQLSGYEDYIGAIDPADEPYLAGLSQSDLETAIAGLKAAFPGIPIYVNFAWPTVLGLTSETLPAGVDWIAFDKYDTEGGPVQISEIQTYVNHLKSIKSPDQKLFLVPPSAKSLGGTYTDQQLADTINAFYSLMQSDDEIIGMQVFLADGARQVVFDGIGTTIPLAQAAQESIGLQIIGDVCGDVWTGFYKFDYNKDCVINMIDFAEYADIWLTE